MLLNKSFSYNDSSYIGEKSFFTGEFVSKGSLTIHGKFKGSNIQADQIIIPAKGRVKGTISCVSIDVEGLIIGDIHALNRIFLRPKSKVFGNIETKELIIQNGVMLEGKCIIGEKFNDPQKKYDTFFDENKNDN